MNSLYAIDRATHIKIVLVALAAAGVVAAIGLTGNLSGADVAVNSLSAPSMAVERIEVQPTSLAPKGAV